jgi:hypothetical protein
MPCARARRRCHAKTIRRNAPSRSEKSAGSVATWKRMAHGKVSTHWRYGTRGSTRSTRSAAMSAARLDQQLGQSLPLQLNASSLSNPQAGHRSLAKPLPS